MVKKWKLIFHGLWLFILDALAYGKIFKLIALFHSTLHFSTTFPQDSTFWWTFQLLYHFNFTKRMLCLLWRKHFMKRLPKGPKSSSCSASIWSCNWPDVTSRARTARRTLDPTFLYIMSLLKLHPPHPSSSSASKLMVSSSLTKPTCRSLYFSRRCFNFSICSQRCFPRSWESGSLGIRKKFHINLLMAIISSAGCKAKYAHNRDMVTALTGN